MAGIEIRTDLRAAGLPQAQQRLRIVHAKARMHLNGNFIHMVLSCEGAKLLPVGNQHLFPLIAICRHRVKGPYSRCPVGVFCIFFAAGAAGKAADGIHAHSLRHQHAIAHNPIVALCNFGDGMYRVAVAGKCTDLQSGRLNGFPESFHFLIVMQQDFGIAMMGARRTAAANLHHFHSHSLEICQRFIQ